MNRECIIVLDFGGQYTHLIARRVRELRVYSEILPYYVTTEEIIKYNPKGIILSGGPSSVYVKDAPKPDPRIFNLGIPILGICYGHQLIAQMMGGTVSKGVKGEYGKSVLKIVNKDEIFEGLNDEEVVWMSHKDQVTRLPDDFIVLAHTEVTPIAAFKHKKLPIYGVQFHPEVIHTKNGKKIFKNFLFKVCKCKGLWNPLKEVDRIINEIKEKVGDDKVLCAVSGGVDSLTTLYILKRAIGNNVIAVFVNHGLLRKNEEKEVLNLLRDLGVKYVYIDATERFLSKLKGVKNPELKRKIIGEEFIRIFEEVAKKLGVKWLAQGTIYPDRIESGRVGHRSSVIKSHHNVGGLPRDIKLKLIEPLKDFYKDEVREIAKMLGVPEKVIKRHPFPGPGLAVRIIGEVTKDKLRIVREASAIVEEELKKAGLYDKVWQAFAVVGNDTWVGVVGDERKVGYIVIIRVVESVDAMTADWCRLPYDLLERISRRIYNEVSGVTMVTYAITPKPPSTIEPQ